jgi:hypothetical protein
MNYCKSINEKFRPYLRDFPVTCGTSFRFLVSGTQCSPFWNEIEEFGPKKNMTRDETEKIFNKWLIASLKRNLTLKQYISFYSI